MTEHHHDIESNFVPIRMRSVVSLAWSLFAKKVGGGLIEINKEASMQLQFSYILQQILPLITFNKNEEFKLELETTPKKFKNEIDVFLSGKWRGQGTVKTHRIAVELKCYKELASSGNKRGAKNIFMKDVYEDLGLLEDLVHSNQPSADVGIALVMTDMENLVNPKKKDGRCWEYDISNNVTFGPKHFTTPVAGKPVDIKLQKKYNLQWIRYGGFWFSEIEGKT